MSYPALSRSYVVAPAHNSRAQLAFEVPGGDAYPVTAINPPMQPGLLPIPMLTWEPITPPQPASRLGTICLLALAALISYFYLLFSI
jgi:hypothetical protein